MSVFCSLAYLDAGAGSILLQALVGGAAGMMILAKHFLMKLRVRRSVSGPKSSDAVSAST